MKKFQETLMKDLGWKLLSVAIAAIMWFMVININQPVDTRTYTKNIVLENMDVLTSRGLTITNATELTDSKISIKIKAQRTALDRLNQSMDWLKASVDLSSLAYAVDGDIVTLPVDVAMQGVYSGYNIVSKSPAVVEVRIEKSTSKELPIDLVINGEIAPGKNLGVPKLSNETVVVRGPASVVSSVVAVRAAVNGADVVENAQLRAKLMPYDKNGVPVKGVTTEVAEITVSYGAQNWKRIPIQVNVSGVPGEGYEVGEVIATPTMIEVTGETAVLASLSYLQVADIDVTGSTTAVEKTITLSDYLPQGITLKEGTSTTVHIVVQMVNSRSRDLTIDASRLVPTGEEEGKSYSLSGTVKITLSGAGDILNDITQEELTGTVDVSGLSAGHHRVLAELVLPYGVTASAGYIDVTVVEDGSAPTEES